MELKFKAIEWKQETGTREHADLAFDLEVDVWDYNNVCVWSIGDKHNTYAKGRCKTREQAKAKVEGAFTEYVCRNLEKCCEE